MSGVDHRAHPTKTRDTAVPRRAMSGRSRVATFVAFAVLCAAGAILQLNRSHERLRERAGAAPPTTTATPVDFEAQVKRPSALFRSTAYGASYGRLGLLSLDHLDGPRLMSDMSCDRADMAGGRGVCLRSDLGVVTTFSLIAFDERLRPIGTFPLAGSPSRVRLSPGGRFVASTVFVSGDSYAAASFSTRTTIMEMASLQVIADLEEFTVSRDGQRFKSIDFNFWGVTFARDENTFYATLGTGGHRYLVQGDLAARSIQVLRDGVECPSLSPDGRRIAFKQRVGGEDGRVRWRPALLDLDTLADRPLGETRNVDDQIAWLDDTTVTYGLPEAESGTAITDTWAVAADGTGGPRLLIPKSWSSVFLRP